MSDCSIQSPANFCRQTTEDITHLAQKSIWLRVIPARLCHLGFAAVCAVTAAAYLALGLIAELFSVLTFNSFQGLKEVTYSLVTSTCLSFASLFRNIFGIINPGFGNG